jgi:proline racemase
VNVVIDVPSGRVTARVHRDGDRIRAVDFDNVPSYVLAATRVRTSRGEVPVTLSFGGAIYASVDAGALGLTVTPERITELIALGREVKWALNDAARHPADSRLDGVYGTILVDDLGVDPAGDLYQRNVTVFADGEVDRSPCGSGTCARLAVLAASGALAPGQALVHDSVVGSRFVGRVLEHVTAHGRPAVVPRVTGMAYPTGEHVFHVDPDDPLVPGFVLR